MTGFLHHLGISLRLYFRNGMALLYGYLFPAIFLIAFWVLYRHERVPLVRHMGELLTVAVLGGACFGLPTTMVSERERGVWRRYRLAPVSTASLVASTVAARYVLLITAGLLQLALAMGIGMPMPQRVFHLWIAFSVVSFAFLGLGLVIATLADNVPAVQALGQCIFLPMLIIGGVAVPLTTLPEWAQHVSAFFPGRYAVQVIQACVSGGGLGAARFSLLALLVIGSAGCLAGARMFRWDTQQRFAAMPGKGWIAVALAAWVGVGLLAELRGQIRTGAPASGATEARRSTTAPDAASPAEPDTARVAPRVGEPEMSRAEKRATSTSPPPPSPVPVVNPGPRSWQAVTVEDIDRDLLFNHLPSDSGIISPIAPPQEVPDPDLEPRLAQLRNALTDWGPGKVGDPVQRVRNYLMVAAVPDVSQRPLERFAPRVVFERLQQDVPKADLIKILYWIAMHPDAGDDSAADELAVLGIEEAPGDSEQVRERVALYGVKLLGRLLGRIPL